MGSINTPYEKHHNMQTDVKNGHGTCGVGVGQTYQREEDFYSITAGDLLYKDILRIKVDLLKQYYPDHYNLNEQIKRFFEYCNIIPELGDVIVVDDDPHKSYDNFIFEGSQGLLLDQNIGFFPHVTRGNTGTKNILRMGFKPEIYLVIRAYQTRHGNGPMTNQDKQDIPNNPYEHNRENGYQGKFRKSILDLDLVKYGIEKDKYIKNNNITLIITCLDVIEDYLFTINGRLYKFKNEQDFIKEICSYLKISRWLISRDPTPILTRE